MRFSRNFGVNTMSHYFLLREFLPGMIARKTGHIVRCCSTASSLQVTERRHPIAGLGRLCTRLRRSVSSIRLLRFQGCRRQLARNSALRARQKVRRAALGPMIAPADEAPESTNRHGCPGIRTTLVCPGFIQTPLFAGSKPFLSSLELAEAALTVPLLEHSDTSAVPFPHPSAPSDRHLQTHHPSPRLPRIHRRLPSLVHRVLLVPEGSAELDERLGAGGDEGRYGHDWDGQGKGNGRKREEGHVIGNPGE